MDSNDIFDPQFSLNTPESLVIPVINEMTGINEITGINGMTSINETDYTMFMYIGAVIFLGLIGILIYKKYVDNKNKQDDSYTQDCPGGFCTINQNNPN